MGDDFVDDILFEGPSSQEYFDNPNGLIDESEGEILFEDFDDEPTLWDIEGVPVHVPFHEEPRGSASLILGDRNQPPPANTLDAPNLSLLRNRSWVVARIEAMVENIMHSLFGEGEAMTITLKSRASLSRRQVDAREGPSELPKPKERSINFPGASAQEAWNFTVLIRMLEIIHSGLVNNTVMTKRDIFYRHPDLFVKQTVVDRYVDDLACTFGVNRARLNVTAAAKGLVAGNFTFLRPSGHETHVINEKDGILVPDLEEHDVLSMISAHWILVIEKEAVFRSLLSSLQWEKLKLHGVVVTAKGYPDLASRRFLRQLADHGPGIPMYALVDLDPDGIAIMSTYKYGSYRLAHEEIIPNRTPALCLPDIRWLGVKSQHICRAPIEDTETSAMPRLQGVMRLTRRDRTKAMRMLEWDLCADNGPELEWRQELQRALMLNIKAEMQILDELPGGLVSWLSSELEQAHEQPITHTCAEDGMLF